MDRWILQSSGAGGEMIAFRYSGMLQMGEEAGKAGADRGGRISEIVNRLAILVVQL